MVHVYFASVFEGVMEAVFPPRRQAQLEETKNENCRRQRYSVWKLLEYGLRRSLGRTMEQLDFSLDDRGRWSCDQCFFSLSHSGNAVALAISDAPVGVDVEDLQRSLHPALPGKILTEPEQGEFAALDEGRQNKYLLEKWCCKESCFKFREAAKVEGTAEKTCAGTVTVAGQVYCYAVTTKNKVQPKLFVLEDDLWN